MVPGCQNMKIKSLVEELFVQPYSQM